MGRSRKLDGEAILKAAEAVARRDGTAGLTLEAVASSAGCGKATVLYDHKTMNGLVVALVRHLLDQEEARLADLQAGFAGEPDAVIRSRIVAADRGFTEEERSLVTMIVAALAHNAELKEAARAFFARSLADVKVGSSFPDAALVAFLALHGLINLRSLGLFDWEADAVRALLDDIAAVALNPLPETPPSARADRTTAR